MKKLCTIVLSFLFITTCSITVFFLATNVMQPTLTANPLDLSGSDDATLELAPTTAVTDQSTNNEYQQKRAKLLSLYKLGDPRLESTIM